LTHDFPYQLSLTTIAFIHLGQLAVVGVLMDSDEFEGNPCLQVALENAPKGRVEIPLGASKASVDPISLIFSSSLQHSFCRHQRSLQRCASSSQVLDPTLLLPTARRGGDSEIRSRGYVHYPGSLTTPPCSEVVDWFILSDPISVSDHQVCLNGSGIVFRLHWVHVSWKPF
jgi:carbonic anhydrase